MASWNLRRHEGARHLRPGNPASWGAVLLSGGGRCAAYLESAFDGFSPQLEHAFRQHIYGGVAVGDSMMAGAGRPAGNEVGVSGS